MVKIEARLNVEGDSYWYKAKYMLAFPFKSLKSAESLMTFVRVSAPQTYEQEPKCLDFRFVEERKGELIVETSELEKVAHLVDILDGAMRGLGLDGKVTVENNKIEVIL